MHTTYSLRRHLRRDRRDLDLADLAANIRTGKGTPEDHALLLARVRATLAESNPRALG